MEFSGRSIAERATNEPIHKLRERVEVPPNMPGMGFRGDIDYLFHRDDNQRLQPWNWSRLRRAGQLRPRDASLKGQAMSD